MITSLVAEGRTVVLSSHLLDEVERTCNAVAIVDQGKVIRQGPIAGLLADSAFELQIDCSTPDRAGTLLADTQWGTGVTTGPDGLRVGLAPGTEREVVSEINRLLVEGGVSVYRLQEVHASLESWFLEVTTRLGADQ
jgi:ABC-2 type transport system ATP-binding protein